MQSASLIFNRSTEFWHWYVHVLSGFVCWCVWQPLRISHIAIQMKYFMLIYCKFPIRSIHLLATNNTSPCHQDEIAALEAQMGNASTYAAAGLKRRLQTLKAWRSGVAGHWSYVEMGCNGSWDEVDAGPWRGPAWRTIGFDLSQKFVDRPFGQWQLDPKMALPHLQLEKYKLEKSHRWTRGNGFN